MTWREVAPAKLTLSLRVRGRRPDGFHDLEALTVSTDEPSDVVEVDPSDGGSTLELDGVSEGVPADATNLVLRALGAAKVSARVRLTKCIPAGSGLGGGSSDAAAVLRVLREHFGVSEDLINAVAAQLGSDVPFCVHGGPAWMRGLGEIIEPVALREPIHVVVVTPPFSIATADVYRAWDELGGPVSTRAVPAPTGVAHLMAELVNDLEPAAEHVEPRLRPFRDGLETSAGTPALLAGSGSSYAMCFDDPGEWRSAAARVSETLSVTAHLAITR